MRRLISLIFLALMACKDDPTPATMISYFKDDQRNRVFVFNLEADATPAAVLEKAQSEMHTDRQFTVTFFYPPNTAPTGDPITLARNYSAAMEIMHSKPWNDWRFYYVKAPAGNETFLDCGGADKANDLCER